MRKKLKQPSFAAGVHRDEVYAGAELLGLELDEHIANVVAALQPIAGELGLRPYRPRRARASPAAAGDEDCPGYPRGSRGPRFRPRSFVLPPPSGFGGPPAGDPAPGNATPSRARPQPEPGRPPGPQGPRNGSGVEGAGRPLQPRRPSVVEKSRAWPQSRPTGLRCPARHSTQWQTSTSRSGPSTNSGRLRTGSRPTVMRLEHGQGGARDRRRSSTSHRRPG